MIPDNLIIEYYTSGKVCSITEVNDMYQRHGLFVNWYVDGAVYEVAHYDYDLRHGTQTFWCESGAMFSKADFKHGKRHSIYCFYANDGTPDVTRLFDNGDEVTELVKPLVKDIHDITDHEKTQLALLHGIIL